MGADDRRRGGDYRAARIGAAAALFGVAVVLLLADVWVDSYDVEVPVIVVLLASGGGLLGVELLGSVLRALGK